MQQKVLKLLRKPVHIQQTKGLAAAIVADQKAKCVQCSLLLLQVVWVSLKNVCASASDACGS